MKKCITKCILVTAFNRPSSLRRLLNNLSLQNFTNTDLLIYIDNDGSRDCHKVAFEHHWPFGKKIIEFQKSNVGLKENVTKGMNRQVNTSTYYFLKMT